MGLGQSHGVQAPGEGARRVVGLRLHAEGAAACGAAGRAAAGAQREVLGLSGVIHVVGGPDVLHGRVLAALLGPEERVLQHPARAARETVGCAARNAHGQPPLPPRQLPPRQPAFQQPRPRWAQGCCSFCQAPPGPAPRPPSSTACAAPHSTSCARCPASSRRRSTSEPAAEAARTGQHVQAHVLGGVLGQLRAEGLRGCKPRGPCAYEVRCRLRAVCSAAQTFRDGGRPLSTRSSSTTGSAVALVPPRKAHVLVRGLCAEAVPGIACRGVCCRGQGLLDCAKSSR